MKSGSPTTGKDRVYDPVKDGDEEGLDDLYLAKTGYTILSKMGMRKRMRTGLMTCIWSGLILRLPTCPSIRVA
jgi:hypothetical protein